MNIRKEKRIANLTENSDDALCHAPNTRQASAPLSPSPNKWSTMFRGHTWGEAEPKLLFLGATLRLQRRHASRWFARGEITSWSKSAPETQLWMRLSERAQGTGALAPSRLTPLPR